MAARFRMSWLVLLFLFACFAGPAHAGGASVGTNFGFTHSSFENRESVSYLSVPNTSGVLVAFSPGLRISRFVDDERKHEVIVDVGLLLGTLSNVSITSLQLLVGYQHAFLEGNVSPTVSVGGGLLYVGGIGADISAPVIGGGVGVAPAALTTRSSGSTSTWSMLRPKRCASGSSKKCRWRISYSSR